MDIEALTSEIEALTQRANEALEAAKTGDTSVEEVKSLVNDEIKPEIDRLKAERADAERDAQVTALTEAFGTLQSQMSDLKKPWGDFTLGGVESGAGEEGKALDIYEAEQ